MKKKSGFLLLGICLLFGLSACSNNLREKGNRYDEKKANDSIEQPTPAPSPAGAGGAAAGGASSATGQSSSSNSGGNTSGSGNSSGADSTGG